MLSDEIEIIVSHKYTYNIRIGENEVPVYLTFVDGKFVDGNFPFNGEFDRETWKIKSTIINKIEEIEKELSDEKNDERKRTSKTN